MLEELNAIDVNVFLFLNHLHNPVLDVIMYWVSKKSIWIPLYGFLAYFIYRKYPERFFVILFCIAIVIALSDQLSSSVLKNSVMRLRPCHDPSLIPDIHLVNGECGGMYGFVSSHASNSFALLAFLTFLFRKKYLKLQWALLGWAVLVSYSRIYLGVHFPGDVICGALLGSIIGISVLKSFRYYERHFIFPKTNATHHSHKRTK